MATIHTIAWIVLMWNVFAIIGRCSIGKLLFDSKFFWLQAILNPDRVSKDIQNGAEGIGKSVLWIIGSIIVLSL